jgi:hypothetical protein
MQELKFKKISKPSISPTNKVVRLRGDKLRSPLAVAARDFPKINNAQFRLAGGHCEL